MVVTKRDIAKIISKHFTPIQWSVIKSNSRVILWIKTRGCGGTRVIAFKDVFESFVTGDDVHFSSISAENTKSYADFCNEHIEYINKVLTVLGYSGSIAEISAVRKKQFKSSSIVIHSSNPASLRSNTGIVTLDEIDWHKNQPEMYASAQGVNRFGRYKMRLVTSVSHVNTLINALRSSCATRDDWQLFLTNIYDAANDGIIDKIHRRVLSVDERNKIIDKVREDVGEDIFNREYLCIPSNSSDMWLPLSVVKSCISEECTAPYAGGVCYIGIDVARHKHFYVIWVAEVVNDRLVNREIVSLQNVEFDEMHRLTVETISKYSRIGAILIDKTSMGEAPAERLRKEVREKVIALNFTASLKFEMSIGLRLAFETKRVAIPNHKLAIESHASIKRIFTGANNIIFDSSDNASSGHGDHYWAHAMAYYGFINHRVTSTFASNPTTLRENIYTDRYPYL